MEHWKRALLAASAGASAILFLRGRKTEGVLLAGVGLVTLASEYPEKFAQIRDRLPDYADRGQRFLDLVARVAERLAEAGQRRSARWYEELMSRE